MFQQPLPVISIEPNQEAAMTMWEAQGNEHCYFAMKLNDGQIYMIHFDELCLRQLYGQGSITSQSFQSTRPFKSGWRK